MKDAERFFKMSGIYVVLMLSIILSHSLAWASGTDEPATELAIEEERMEAEQEGFSMMEKIQDIYQKCDKGISLNIVLSKDTIRKIAETLGHTSFPVVYDNGYDKMYNYEIVNDFLMDAGEGKEGSVTLYEVHNDGGLGRNKFTFDGSDMYVYYTGFSWKADNTPCVISSAYMRIKQWDYTDKGWFCYEYCVPQPPAVSERINSEFMVRVKPLNDKCREISEKYLQPLGYQGNNLLRLDWDKEHLEKIDYNGLFEYLYLLEYQEKFDFRKYREGIPKDEFEQLMTSYLPITIEQLQQFAVYDESSQTYAWDRLGYYSAEYMFVQSIPEVVKIEEQEDGTLVLTVDVVSEMLLSDCLVSHKLTVQLQDGKIRFLGNEILGDGINNIPPYQYRLKTP